MALEEQWNLNITKCQWTGKICLLYRGLVILRYFFIYFAITRVKKIKSFFVPRTSLYRGLLYGGSTVHDCNGSGKSSYSRVHNLNIFIIRSVKSMIILVLFVNLKYACLPKTCYSWNLCSSSLHVYVWLNKFLNGVTSNLRDFFLEIYFPKVKLSPKKLEVL